MDYIGLILSMALGFTFFLSGLLKMFDLRASVIVSETVGILPRKMSTIFGYFLPFLELLISIALLLNIQPQLINIILLLLIISFIVANIKTIIEGKNINCNCFGPLISGKMGVGALYHSSILFLFALLLLFFEKFGVQQMLLVLNFNEAAQIWISSATLFAVGLASRLID